MFWRKKKEAADEMPEYPKIYVRDNGSWYIKPNELLRSKAGQRALEEVAAVERALKARQEQAKQQAGGEGD